jgi:hypothetical protein
VNFVDRANLTTDERLALTQELPDWGTLQEFVVWGLSKSPPALLIETVEQDEYTHDVIARYRDGLVFVLGST